MSLLGYALLSTSLLVTYFADSFALAQLAIASAGVGAGLLFPISLTLAADMEQAERAYAVKLAAEQLVPACLLLLVSLGLLMSRLDNLLLAMIAVIAVCMLLSQALPASGKPDEEMGSASGSLFLSVLALVALSVTFAGFAGIWVFLERIGADADLDPAFTSLWLAVGLVTSGIGPILAAIYGEQSGVIRPIAIGMGLALLTIGLMTAGIGKLIYAFVLTLLPLTYYFALSYVMSLVAEADVNGKMAGLMSFALAVGAALGPAFFGAIRELDGPVLGVMCLLIATGTGLILLVAQRVVPHRAAIKG